MSGGLIFENHVTDKYGFIGTFYILPRVTLLLILLIFQERTNAKDALLILFFSGYLVSDHNYECHKIVVP